MKKVIILIIIVITSAAYATIYVNENQNGSIEYTDTPTTTSTKATLPEVNTITTPKSAEPVVTSVSPSTTTSVDNANTAPASTAGSYKTFEIVSPVDNASIQNQPVVSVEMTVEPNMLPGDKIQLMLDNAPAGTPTSTTYQELANVDRGTHTIYAVIVNNKNQVIKKSSTITINVHRNSVVPSPNVQRAN